MIRNSSVNPANLLETCQKCHPGVSEIGQAPGQGTTKSAWNAHHCCILYRCFLRIIYTPVVLWIAGIYVLLQILRATVDRVRRSLR